MDNGTDKNLPRPTVIFSNESDELTHDEVWDDELLIAQYDDSMKIARKQLANKLQEASSLSDSDSFVSHQPKVLNNYSPNKSKVKKGRKKYQWHTGDPCRASYSEDGDIYEATIIGLNQADGTCTVRYLGYNNHEEVSLSSLIKCGGERARKQQTLAAESHSKNAVGSTEENIPNEERRNKNHKKPKRYASSEIPPPNHESSPRMASFSIPHIPELPPPPALGLIDGEDQMSSEALHTMLMSWYMTGYHTGYYQGLTQGRRAAKSYSSKTT